MVSVANVKNFFRRNYNAIGVTSVKILGKYPTSGTNYDLIFNIIGLRCQFDAKSINTKASASFFSDPLQPSQGGRRWQRPRGVAGQAGPLPAALLQRPWMADQVSML